MTQQSLAFAAPAPSLMVTQESDRWWTVGGAICIAFIHLTTGWRFWPVRDADETLGDFGGLADAVAAARAEIQRDPARYIAEAAARVRRGHRIGPEVKL